MNCLIIAAHPDDEVLGCGGTVAKLVEKGYEAFTLILGEGVTSRDVKRKREIRENEIMSLKQQVLEANKILGVKEVFTFDFPDNRFDSVDLLDIVKTIEKIKNEVKPEIVFTHYEYDLNIDHQITYKAVMTAFRPLREETVKKIYSFEVLSSTEWSYTQGFIPNVYFNIEDTIEKKIEAMRKYKNELRDYPHPRSIEGIKIKAQQRGLEVGLKYAEAFKLVREINE